jgi:hypothetical protein
MQAFAGLGKITQMFMPLVWAAALQFFSGGGGGRVTPRWLRWGAGGHLFLVGVGRLLSWAMLRSARPEDLFLQDDETARLGQNRPTPA